MAIKGANLNVHGFPQNSLSFSEIENEFGNNVTRSMGGYRMQNLNIGDLTEVSLSRDGSGPNANNRIPVDNEPISFSHFFSSKQNIIIDFYTNNQNRVNAKTDKYNSSNPNGRYVVVGSVNNAKPSSTSGKKVIIHVNKTIGSEQNSRQHCALRTGSWNAGTELLVEVGSGGFITGAGGKGGNSNRNAQGDGGNSGTSALGIQYSGTVVQTTGGKIYAGFGGGGAGGGGETKKEGSRWGGGRGPEVVCAGGGGGGGAGTPAGGGGTSPDGAAFNGQAGNANSAGEGRLGANPVSRGDAGVQGGRGGDGGWISGAGQVGLPGAAANLTGRRHENPGLHGGGNGGGNGAGIRKTNNSVSFTLVGGSNVFGSTNENGVS